jgi:long-chain fatty acid transport protein
MDRTWKASATVAVLLLAWSGAACGGAFSIYEAGAKATALGGAFTATADDPSAVFYNPAGLAWLDGTRIDLNLMPIVPSTKFSAAESPASTSPGATGRTTDQMFPIPGAYGSHRLSDRLTIGLGFNAPFGLGVEWQDPRDWVGREASYKVDLATFYATPAVAWRVSGKLAIAAGADVAWSSLKLKQMKTAGGPVDVLDAEMSGTSRVGAAPMAGVMYRPRREISVGLTFHGQQTMKVRNQDATITNIAPAALLTFADSAIASLGGGSHKVSTDLKLPWILSAGFAWQPGEKTRLEVDAVRFGWSHFDELALTFDDLALDETLREAYQDAWQMRFGVSHRLSESLLGLAGYCYDVTPQPAGSMSPLLPDATRNDFSLGLQWRHGALELTGSYMAVVFQERSNVQGGEPHTFEPVLPAGTYASLAHIFGLGVGYQF